MLELLSTKDREGSVVTYDYDEYGNVKKQTNPDTSFKTFTYDAAGNLLENVDEDGGKKTYVYKNNIIESENMLINKDSTGKEEFATTLYKANNSNKIKGLIDSRKNSDGKSEVSYTYDNYGYLNSEKDEVGNRKITKYNAQGLKEQEYIDAGLITDTLKKDYVYAKDGKLETTKLNRVANTTTIYDDYGRIESEKDAENNGKLYSYYPGTNLIKAFTNEKGQIINYTSFVDGNRNEKVSTYSKVGKLETESKADGGYKKLKYNTRGLLEVEYEKNIMKK